MTNDELRPRVLRELRRADDALIAEVIADRIGVARMDVFGVLNRMELDDIVEFTGGGWILTTLGTARHG